MGCGEGIYRLQLFSISGRKETAQLTYKCSVQVFPNTLMTPSRIALYAGSVIDNRRTCCKICNIPSFPNPYLNPYSPHLSPQNPILDFPPSLPHYTRPLYAPPFKSAIPHPISLSTTPFPFPTSPTLPLSTFLTFQETSYLLPQDHRPIPIHPIPCIHLYQKHFRVVAKRVRPSHRSTRSVESSSVQI